MHLGNGAMTPECAYLTLGAAAAGLVGAAVAARREPFDRGRLATAGVLCAAVYAAQMVNVPVLPFSSGHLVGGVLLAWCLGPALGSLTMAVVLGVQAVCLGDGGVLAWGANVINMALLPAGLVWLVNRGVRGNTAGVAAGDAFSRRAGIPFLAIGATSFVSVLLAAVLIVGEVALIRAPAELLNLGPFATRMVALHAWIGLGEAVVTCAVLFALHGFSLRNEQPHSSRLDRWRLAGVAAVSIALVLFCLPLASSLPDGYEAAVQASGWQSALLDNAPEFSWQTAIQSGLAGSLPAETLVAFVTMCFAALCACGVASLFRPRPALAKVSPNRRPLQ